MWKKFKDQILTDLKISSLNYRLLITPGILFLLILMIPFFFPVVSHHAYLYQGLQPAKYYTLVAITLSGLLPVVTGVSLGRIIRALSHNGDFIDPVKTASNIGAEKFSGVFLCLITGFLLVIISILFIEPVPSQGWLRTLYAAILLSFQAPAAMILVSKQSLKRGIGISFSILYIISLILLPVGLMLHHPMNYPAFISPFYWSAWAWMIRSPSQGVICGIIAILLTVVFCFPALRNKSGQN